MKFSKLLGYRYTLFLCFDTSWQLNTFAILDIIKGKQFIIYH